MRLERLSDAAESSATTQRSSTGKSTLPWSTSRLSATSAPETASGAAPARLSMKPALQNAETVVNAAKPSGEPPYTSSPRPAAAHDACAQSAAP